MIPGKRSSWKRGPLRPAALRLRPAGEAAEAFILDDEPNRVTVGATLERRGWLVLLDNDFPGWKVEVDRAPERILRADFAFRAVALPAGHHDVVFRYQPESLYWGFGLSVFGLLAAAGIALSTLKKGKPEGRA